MTSLAVLNESVFASAGSAVVRYVRGREIGRFVTQSTVSDFTSDDSDSSDSESGSSTSSDSSDSDDSDDERGEAGEERLSNVLLFGSTLMALSTSGKRMYVWDVPAYVKPASRDPAADQEDNEGEDEEEGDGKVVTPYATLEMPNGFTATKLVHPASYLNKVVVGSKEGELAVWNIRTG